MGAWRPLDAGDVTVGDTQVTIAGAVDEVVVARLERAAERGADIRGKEDPSLGSIGKWQAIDDGRSEVRFLEIDQEALGSARCFDFDLGVGTGTTRRFESDQLGLVHESQFAKTIEVHDIVPLRGPHCH